MAFVWVPVWIHHMGYSIVIMGYSKVVMGYSKVIMGHSIVIPEVC